MKRHMTNYDLITLGFAIGSALATIVFLSLLIGCAGTGDADADTSPHDTGTFSVPDADTDTDTDTATDTDADADTDTDTGADPGPSDTDADTDTGADPGPSDTDADTDTGPVKERCWMSTWGCVHSIAATQACSSDGGYAITTPECTCCMNPPFCPEDPDGTHQIWWPCEHSPDSDGFHRPFDGTNKYEHLE